MSHEIEDTLLADEDSSSSSADKTVSPSSADKTVSSSSADKTVSPEVAKTLVASPDSDMARNQTVGAVESKSTWIPLTVRKAQLATVSRSNYEIHREIARGGMGRVLSAQDTRLGRRVAIKELLRGSTTAHARFEREAIITARLQHPAIVPLYEAGHWPNGEPFFAMKMVAGDPLDQVARACKTSADRVALVNRVIDVADALAYAHSKEVIHRDLKPANILVGDFGETVVIDWGLAKSLSDEEEYLEEEEDADDVESRPDSEILTVLGQAMGTPAYMAPEQARGERVDKRADVYSLGAILYHVLSGDMAYAGSKSAAEVLSKVLQGPPKPLQVVTEGLAAPLVTIVNKAMARDREDRYQDASILADELRRYQAGQLVNAHEYSLRALALRWVKGHKAIVASLAAIFLVATVAALLSFRSIGRERDLAMEARNQANASAELAQKERTIARRKSVELGLSFAFSLAAEQPLQALQELDSLEGIGEYPEMVARARVIAGEARSHRVTTELTQRGMRHGQYVLSPDDREVAVPWNHKGVALIDLQTRNIEMLEAITLPSVNFLQYTPDGVYLIVVGNDSDGGVVLWHRERREIVAQFEVDSGVQGIEVSPDSRWLAVRRFGRILLYDLSTASEVAQSIRKLELSGVNSLKFSPDSRRIAILASDVHLYDLETHTGTLVVEGEVMPGRLRHRSTYRNLLFSPDSKKLILAKNQVSILDIESGKLEKLFVATKSVSSMAMSKDGRTIVGGSDDKLVYIYDFNEKGNSVLTLSGHREAVNTVTLVGDDNELISCGRNGSVRVWHIGKRIGRSFYDGQIPEVVTEQLRQSQVPVVSSDQSTIIAYDRFGALRSWERARPDVEFLGPVQVYSQAKFSVGDKRLVWSVGGIDKRIGLVDDKGKKWELGSHDSEVQALAISDDDRYVASGGKHIRLWDLQAGTSRLIESSLPYLRNFAFVGDTLLAAYGEGKVMRYELATGKGEQVADHGNHLLGMVGFVADPKGRWVATSGTRRKVWVYDLTTGEKRLVADGVKNAQGLAVSPDGELLAFSNADSEVQVLRPLQDKEAVVLRSPETREHLAFPSFSPDGRSIVLGSRHMGLRLWEDWKAKPESSTVFLSRDELVFPRFSPDGRLVVAAGGDSGISSIWEVATGQRRDLRGQSISSKAQFWAAGNRVVVSNSSGVVALWFDDLPHGWAELHAWIRQQIADHEMKRKKD